MMKRLRSLRSFFAGIVTCGGAILAWQWSGELAELAQTNPYAQDAVSGIIAVPLLLAVAELRLRRYRREIGAHLFYLSQQNSQTAAGLGGIAQALVDRGILGEKIPEGMPPAGASGGGTPGALLH